MPLSEKKGRFTVSVSEQPRAASPQSQGVVFLPSCNQQAAGSPPGAARPEKRGRFLVSCTSAPCPPTAAGAATAGAAGSGLSPLQPSGKGQQKGSPHNNAAPLAQQPPSSPPRASRSICSDDTLVIGFDQAPAAAAVVAAEVTSPCRAANNAQHNSPEPRRVRFSVDETEENPFLQQQLWQQQQQQQSESVPTSTSTNSSSKRHQLQQPEPPRQLKHTRSYCCGRFTVQEAVSVPACGLLHRSVSAPECAATSASDILAAAARAASGGFCSSPGTSTPTDTSSNASSSSANFSCFAQVQQQLATGGHCAELLAANQLMSGFGPSGQWGVSSAHASTDAAAAAAAAAALLYAGVDAHALAAAAPAAVAGRTGSSRGTPLVHSTVSVPVLGSMLSYGTDNNGSSSSMMYASLVGSADCLMSEGSLAAAAAAGGCSAGPSSGWPTAGAASGGRLGSGSSTSSSMLSSCHSSGSAELLSAAAAAAAGQHQHQRMGVKRSPSVSYFRRGRFLVQTTMG